MNNDTLQELLHNRNGLLFNLNDSSTKTDITKRTLENHGIYDLSTFSNPKPNIDFKVSTLNSNIQNKYFANHFADELSSNNRRYTILVDNDADGFSSAAFLYLYLKNFTDKVDFIFSNGKTHGINKEVLEDVIRRKTDFLLVPDAGSNDYHYLSELSRHGIEYLVIDHHDFNNEELTVDSFLPIISNQYTNSGINKNFTGVGMVYLFTKMLDEYLHNEYAKQYLYLFSLGQIADVSDISDLEIRYLMLKGFKEIDNSPLLKLTVDVEHLSPHELSFSIIPKINAVCRTGSINDKQDLMKSLAEDIKSDSLFELEQRKKNKITGKFDKKIINVDFYTLESKKLNTLQARQKRQINTAMKKLTNIKQNDMLAVVIDEDNTINHSESGLLATKLCNKLQKPTLVLHPTSKDDKLSGSGRGFVKITPNFKQYCLDSKLFEWAVGHDNAFGASIKWDNLKKLFNSNNTANSSIVYDIDNIYINDLPTAKNIYDFDANRIFFGGKIKEPQLGFVSLNIPMFAIKFRGNMMNFTKAGISFVMFTTSDKFKSYIENKKSKQSSITFDIYGTPTVNRYMKKEFPQIIINDIKVADPIIESYSNNISNDLYDF